MQENHQVTHRKQSQSPCWLLDNIASNNSSVTGPAFGAADGSRAPITERLCWSIGFGETQFGSKVLTRAIWVLAWSRITSYSQRSAPAESTRASATYSWFPADVVSQHAVLSLTNMHVSRNKASEKKLAVTCWLSLATKRTRWIRSRSFLSNLKNMCVVICTWKCGVRCHTTQRAILILDIFLCQVDYLHSPLISGLAFSVLLTPLCDVQYWTAGLGKGGGPIPVSVRIDVGLNMSNMYDRSNPALRC